MTEPAGRAANPDRARSPAAADIADGPAVRAAARGPAVPADERPLDPTPVSTADLPPTPVRDRNIPATAWREAPTELLHLGDDLPGGPVATYKRRIGRWSLWRSGPATRGDARYWAADPEHPSPSWTFRLFPTGHGDGVGPSGTRHTRFRAWKEDLRDAPEAEVRDDHGGASSGP